MARVVGTDGVRRGLRAPWALPLVVMGVIVLPQSAPGSPIAEQRARLPPAAHCSDPVAGIWRSHDWHEGYEEWALFTLEIRRVDGSATALEGKLINRSWDGPRSASEPPACAGHLDYEVHMNGRGTYDDGMVRFEGVDWWLERLHCGSSYGFAYNLDRFSGQIDPEIQEFQSLNNDGGRYVNVPTVFRRVECFEESPPPSIEVAIPPLFEESGRSGCNRR